MRTSDRNRCRSTRAAGCVAIIIALFAAPCAALYAEYHVLPNGTAYNASIDLSGVDRFEFSEVGILGERIPIRAGNIRLDGNCSPCNYTSNGVSAISFEKGNYTLFYTAPLREFHLQATFDKPYSVKVSLPEGFDAKNPLLAGISPGATVNAGSNNSTTILWNKTMAVDLRFYDRNREALLYLFGNFWIVIAIVLLMPFFLTMRRAE
jgi:hypothetical protein